MIGKIQGLSETLKSFSEGLLQRQEMPSNSNQQENANLELDKIIDNAPTLGTAINKSKPLLNLSLISPSLQNQNFSEFNKAVNSHNTDLSAILCSCSTCSLATNPNTKLGSQNQTSTTLQSSPAGSTLSGDYQINNLLSGYQWTLPTNRQLTFSFYEDSVFNGGYYGSETGVREVSEAIKTSVRNILNWVETAINIDFVEVTETNTSTYGQMRFLLSNGPSYAYGYYPSSHVLGGDVHLNPSYDRLGDTNGFQNPAGFHGYMTLVHEIGHALGLKHSFETPALPVAEDNIQNTVMTYNFGNSNSSTFMLYDIKALQYLYGAKSYNSGDTTYLFSRVDQFAVGGQNLVSAINSIKQTLWDSGGVDTLDFSQLATDSSGYRFDLNQAGMLTTRSAFNATVSTLGTAIAYNVLIENLINSSSSEDIILNSAANRVRGYTTGRFVGSDLIWNATSQDILELSGYSSANVTQTQSGNDLILGLGSNGSVTIKDYYAGAGMQIVYGDTIIQNPVNNGTLSISDVSIIEGNNGTTNVVFTVTLSQANSNPVTVNYATADGTATIAGNDYLATSGILSFNPGEISKTVSVAVVGDTINEANETFFLNLSGATNASITDSQGVATIQDDDPTISINDVTAAEGARGTRNFTFTVSLSKTSSQTITVNYATANGNSATATNNATTANNDYRATSGILTFNPGVTSQTITVQVVGDRVSEGNESFLLNLSNVTGNASLIRSQGIGTILNDDSNSSPAKSTVNSPSRIIQGTTNSEPISGSDSRDLLVGVDLNSTIPGIAEIDTLIGGKGADRFVLGNFMQAFYNDGNDADLGWQDYAIIKDFKIRQGDVIQLHGSASDYQLTHATGNLPPGTAIFLKTSGVNELIGVVQGVTNLSLDSNVFSFV